MTWRDVGTQEACNALLAAFGDFHDSCLREGHIWTDQYVLPDLKMVQAFNLDTKILLSLQRQLENPSAIEMLFDEVTRVNITPSPENHDSLIRCATLLVRGKNIYWSPSENWSPDNLDRDSFTWISSYKLSWREVELTGETLRYGTATN